MKWCPDCGNSGIDINDQVCKCRFSVQTFYEQVSCMEIPEQYRGVKFNPLLLPKDVDESYGKYLLSLESGLLHKSLSPRNIIICCPINHGKTVFAYSLLETLFNSSMDIFPIYDVLEIKRIMTDIDLCRKQFYDIDNPELLFQTQILFAKVPNLLSKEVYESASILIDRRVRRSLTTILLFNGTWEQVAAKDYNGLLTGIIGDGNFGTLEVKSWHTTKVDSSPKEVMLEENIG